MYEFPRLEITPGQERIRAQIIGNTGLAKRIQSLLKNQEVAAFLVEDPASINLSRHSDYVYWLQPAAKIPPVLANYLKSSQTKLIIISNELITDKPNQLITHILDAGIDACQVFVKDVYGPSVGDSGLSLIWRDLKSKFSVNLPDDDSTEIYPIYIDDAAAAIIKISFSTQTYGRTFYIAGIDKTTILSFSYRLREEVVRQTQKLPSINYAPTSLRAAGGSAAISSFSPLASATRDFLNWRPDTDLSEGLKKLVSSCLSPSQVVAQGLTFAPQRLDLKGATKIIKKKTILHFRRGFVFPLALATLFAAATLSLPRLLDYLAAGLAANSPDRLARFEHLFAFFGRRESFYKLRQQAEFNQRRQQLSGLTGQFFQSVFTPDFAPPFEILNRLESESTALLKSLPPGDSRTNLSLSRELVPVVRLALSGDRKKTFLIVLQNSAEIRPTGGFMSSFVFVTVHKGKILDIDYQSVYQLDSQLVGVEPPPAPIADRLGENNWLIRNANWAADGPTASQKISQLINRAVGRSLDGIVFLTTPALQSILAQTGEIIGPDGTVWNQLNIAERLVYADHDSLVSLARALAEFIKINPNRHRVIAGVLTALAQNNLLITSSDPAISQIANTLKVDGSLPPLECLPQFSIHDSPFTSPAACLADQISVVDANLGANKADYFMIKEHDISVSLSTAAQTSSAVTLRYHNSAASSQYPAGTYRNYVRVYLPADSVITSVVRLAPEGLVAVPTDNYLEAGGKVIGWYLEIPPGGQEIFRLESLRSAKLTLQNQTAAYSLAVRKQAGTTIPVSVSVGFPPDLAPLAVSDKVTVAGDKLLLNHSGEENLFLNVEFASVEQ